MSATTLQVAAVVAFYMSSALVMIFVNKAVLNSSPTLPLLFLFLQLIIAVILLHLSALVSSRITLPARAELSRVNAKKLAPVILANIIGLIFNTLCLRAVDASFFQIARGLVLPMTIVASSLATRMNPSIPVVLCATLVTAGYLTGVLPASTRTPPPVFSSAAHPAASRTASLAYGVLSSLFIALHAVLIKHALPHVEGSTIKLAWWTNAGSALILLPFILLAGEPARVYGLFHYGMSEDGGVGGSEAWSWGVFAAGSAVTGVFGFLLCVAGLLSIKVTSPVTHMFSSAARGVLQTLLGVWIFKDILTVTRAASISVILSGTVLYTWVKAQEAEKPKASQEPGDDKA